ncbi:MULTISPECIES: DUF2663 family protein [Bacillus]|uniref:DUF2663 family protein n=1 Tax=Bacillus TaxID=1386 RepID=UPI000681950F|nr:DUF2663 family protein [Bacillus altitudinis]AKU32794.1 hypothetical protein ID12_15725 [Bacillus altitudinis]QQX14844.1 DUF2663 family protein [Bacillus altitudinis]
MTLHAISRYMDQPTQKMIETLIKRKRKYEGFAKQCKRWQWTALLSLAILLFYFVITANSGGSLQPEAMIATLLGHEVFLFWIMAEVFAFYASYYYKKKEEKAEDEYHKLRCEIIQKSTDLWPQSNQWEEREAVFHFMQTQYDINLYYESK